MALTARTEMRLLGLLLLQGKVVEMLLRRRPGLSRSVANSATIVEEADAMMSTEAKEKKIFLVVLASRSSLAQG